MKRSPQTPLDEGVFITVLYQTVVSNVPAIAKMKSESYDLPTFIISHRKELSEAIVRVYGRKLEGNERLLTGMMGLLLGNVRTTNNVWLAGYGLQTLLECMQEES